MPGISTRVAAIQYTYFLSEKHPIMNRIKPPINRKKDKYIDLFGTFLLALIN